MTGSISYNTISIINERTKYHTYYVYQADDNHQQVLEKFAQDLRTLKDYFDDVFLFTIDGADPFKFTVFEYGKPFAMFLSSKIVTLLSKIFLKNSAFIPRSA